MYLFRSLDKTTGQETKLKVTAFQVKTFLRPEIAAIVSIEDFRHLDVQIGYVQISVTKQADEGAIKPVSRAFELFETKEDTRKQRVPKRTKTIQARARLASKNQTNFSSLSTHIAVKYEHCIKEMTADGEGIYIELNEGYQYKGENFIYAKGTADALKAVPNIKKIER